VKLLNVWMLSLFLISCVGAPRMDAPVISEWDARRQLLESLSEWEFTGSINVRDANEAQSSRIRWQQQDERYRINLWGTFNVGATEINGRPGEVRIEQQGEDAIVTESPEEMLYQQIGYELPVTELNYWIKGIPAPGASTALKFADNLQLLSFEQKGWRIDYLGYTNFGRETLPNRIRIQKAPLQLDLIRLTWTLPQPQPQTQP
jgi:outer membrane lipoprotein LolB